jgi:hypothetical protein
MQREEPQRGPAVVLVLAHRRYADTCPSESQLRLAGLFGCGSLGWSGHLIQVAGVEPDRVETLYRGFQHSRLT